jgi:DNA-directed RNA polymerase subunit RPC12/RpoP
MDITFKCDTCGQDILIDEAGAGSVVECPKCKASVMVPVGSGITGPLPLMPRVPTVAQQVIVEKIQGLPLTVRTANEPLRVKIVGLRMSWGDALDATWKVVCCLFLVTLLLAALVALVTGIVTLLLSSQRLRF